MPQWKIRVYFDNNRRGPLRLLNVADSSSLCVLGFLSARSFVVACFFAFCSVNGRADLKLKTAHLKDQHGARAVLKLF